MNQTEGFGVVKTDTSCPVMMRYDEATEEEKIGTKEPTRLCPDKYTDGQKSHQKEHGLLPREQRVQKKLQCILGLLMIGNKILAHSLLRKVDLSGFVNMNMNQWLTGHSGLLLAIQMEMNEFQANYSPFQVKDVLDH